MTVASGSVASLGTYTYLCATSTGCSVSATTVTTTGTTGTGRLGNSLDVPFDGTAPSANAIGITESANPDQQFFNSTSRTYYFGALTTQAAFSFTSVPTDAGSGPDTVQFPNLSGTSGWAGSSGGTIGYQASGTYTSPTYSVGPGATAPAGANVVTTDNNSNSLNTSISFVRDTTAPPTPTAPSLTGGYYRAASVSVTGTNTTDAAAGTNTSASTMLRATATLNADGTCGPFSPFVSLSGWTSGTARTDTTVLDGNCYQYKWQVSDNVGNTSTSAASTTAKVDTAAPVISTAVASQHKIILSYTDGLNLTTTLPVTTAFAVHINGGPGVAPSAIAIAGKVVTLHLAVPIRVNQTVAFDYTPPSTNPVRDLAGNPAPGAGGEPASNETPQTSPKIVFNAAPTSGATATWSMDPDGSNLTKLTTPPAGLDSIASWSPDQTEIVFSRTGTAGGLMLMNADGSNQRVIVPTATVNGSVSPRFSPDGTKIAFEGRVPPGSGNEQIFLVNADGTGLTLVSQDPTKDERVPSWSPDGSKILFQRRGPGPSDAWNLHTMTQSGTGVIQLTTCACYVSAGSWSPDGTQILVSDNAVGLSGQEPMTWRLNSDGTGAVVIGPGGSPVWSPDGSEIVFKAWGLNGGISKMSADGTNVVTLTSSSVVLYASTPDWNGLPIDQQPAPDEEPDPPLEPDGDGTVPDGGADGYDPAIDPDLACDAYADIGVPDWCGGQAPQAPSAGAGGIPSALGAPLSPSNYAGCDMKAVFWSVTGVQRLLAKLLSHNVGVTCGDYYFAVTTPAVK